MKRAYSIGKKPAPKADPAEVARKLKQAPDAARSYRQMSLKLHGPICAKCAREFGPAELHLLTVHHRDGNPMNNPPDGSNWENLCVYCHDDEHSRGILADHISGGRK